MKEGIYTVGRYMATTIQPIILVKVCTRHWAPIIRTAHEQSLEVFMKGQCSEHSIYLYLSMVVTA
jgi:hypothetical protein